MRMLRELFWNMFPCKDPARFPQARPQTLPSCSQNPVVIEFGEEMYSLRGSCKHPASIPQASDKQQYLRSPWAQPR